MPAWAVRTATQLSHHLLTSHAAGETPDSLQVLVTVGPCSTKGAVFVVMPISAVHLLNSSIATKEVTMQQFNCSAVAALVNNCFSKQGTHLWSLAVGNALNALLCSSRFWSPLPFLSSCPDKHNTLKSCYVRVCIACLEYLNITEAAKQRPGMTWASFVVERQAVSRYQCLTRPGT